MKKNRKILIFLLIYSIFLGTNTKSNSLFAKEIELEELDKEQDKSIEDELEEENKQKLQFENLSETEREEQLKNSKQMDLEKTNKKINSTNITSSSNLPKIPMQLEPTKKSDSKIKLKSSVDENGDPIIPKEKIQYLPIETKNKLKFNIIIDYTKSDKNVKFLTEGSESDMLNVISQKEKQEKLKKQKQKEKDEQLKQEKDEQEQQKKQRQETLQKQKQNKNKILIIAAAISFLVILAIGSLFYFKKFLNLEKIKIKLKKILPKKGGKNEEVDD